MSNNNGTRETIYCTKCQMTLHRRTFMSDMEKMVLVCPECGKVWVVPWPLDITKPLKPFEVKDKQTIDRALDGMRL